MVTARVSLLCWAVLARGVGAGEQLSSSSDLCYLPASFPSDTVATPDCPAAGPGDNITSGQSCEVKCADGFGQGPGGSYMYTCTTTLDEWARRVTPEGEGTLTVTPAPVCSKCSPGTTVVFSGKDPIQMRSHLLTKMMASY